jgi:2-isopropylmalate synthase
MNKLIIFDTTLRDGEQSPGASMTKDEKLLIARLLDKMGVDVIEAGFASAATSDFNSIELISREIKNAIVCSLSRAKKNDIEAAALAIKCAKRPRIHTFIATSQIHMKYKLNMNPKEVMKAIHDSVAYARTFVNDVEWTAEDATRTEIDFLCMCVETAIAAGATTVNIPDTVGYTTPSEYFEIISTVKNKVPNIDKAIISVHCHNDLGLATANSLSGVIAGARQIECTINGLGERAGNAAMEEIVMAIKTRNDQFLFTTNIDTTYITKASKLVSNITGFVVPKNKAIVGANAFAHEAGIHQDGILKYCATYEIMNPKSIGLKKSELVLGKHSGRAALKNKLIELGKKITDDKFEVLFTRFKEYGDKKNMLRILMLFHC